MNEREKQHYNTLLESGDIPAADEYAADCGESDTGALEEIDAIIRESLDATPGQMSATLSAIQKVLDRRLG